MLKGCGCMVCLTALPLGMCFLSSQPLALSSLPPAACPLALDLLHLRVTVFGFVCFHGNFGSLRFFWVDSCWLRFCWVEENIKFDDHIRLLVVYVLAPSIKFCLPSTSSISSVREACCARCFSQHFFLSICLYFSLLSDKTFCLLFERILLPMLLCWRTPRGSGRGLSYESCDNISLASDVINKEKEKRFFVFLNFSVCSEGSSSAAYSVRSLWILHRFNAINSPSCKVHFSKSSC